IVYAIAPFEDDLLRWVRSRDGVLGAEGARTYDFTMYDGDVRHNINIFGYETFADRSVNRLEPEVGVFEPDVNELVIERSFLDALDAQIGDEVLIELPNGTFYPIMLAGTVHDLNVEGSAVNSQMVGYVNLRTFNRMGLATTYNEMIVRVERPTLGLFGAPSVVDQAEELRADFERLQYRVFSLAINENREHWSTDLLNGISVVLIVVGFVALLLSSVLVINIISGLIAQQRRQIGVMKLIGAKRGQIIVLYMAMIAVMGVIALVIALPTSLMLAYGMSLFFSQLQLNFNLAVFQPPLWILFIEVLVAVLAPMLAGLGPVLSGTAVPTVVVMSDREEGLGTGSWFDRLLAKFDMPGPLLVSITNTFRRKVRLSLTLISLVVAGMFFMSTLNVRAGLVRDVDILLAMSDFDVQLLLSQSYDQQGIVRRAEQVPGVDYVEGWRSYGAHVVRADGTLSQNFVVFGLDRNSQFVNPPLVEGAWLQPYDAATRDTAVVTAALMREEDLSLGDLITLRSPFSNDVAEEAQWTIVGVVDGNNPTVYAHYDSVGQFAKDPHTADLLLVRTNERSLEVQEAVSAELVAYFDDRDIQVSRVFRRDEIEQDAIGGFSILINILLSMGLLIGVVAGIGLTGTMSLNVMERTREIGVMRSIGATNWALRAIYVGETLLIGLISAVVALPL
ncbi:MAG: FtsX-like permease family protein, partial [Chloroflexota bacterium]